MNPVNFPNPFGGTIKQHADKAAFSDLSLTVICDEDLTAYQEVLDWVISYVKPVDGDQYKEPSVPLSSTNKHKFVDLTIYTLTNKGNRNVAFTYVNIHPTSITPPQLNQQNNDSPTQMFTIDFAYDYFEIAKV
ncbi:tail completion and sheath stabilizer protein [Rhizobium phage RHph_I1_18]|nr:tail completion and sheath stabilizer protein [Rhizobium phage RHph_I1_18]